MFVFNKNIFLSLKNRPILNLQGCKNIFLLGKCYLVNQTRPAEFTRKPEALPKVKTNKKNK